jgi:hypothetical protein
MICCICSISWQKLNHYGPPNYAAFSLLVSYAVQTRYPGSSVLKSDAQHAMKICRQFRLEARRALGL